MYPYDEGRRNIPSSKSCALLGLLTLLLPPEKYVSKICTRGQRQHFWWRNSCRETPAPKETTNAMPCLPRRPVERFKGVKCPRRTGGTAFASTQVMRLVQCIPSKTWYVTVFLSRMFSMRKMKRICATLRMSNMIIPFDIIS